MCVRWTLLQTASSNTVSSTIDVSQTTAASVKNAAAVNMHFFLPWNAVRIVHMSMSFRDDNCGSLSYLNISFPVGQC